MNFSEKPWLAVVDTGGVREDTWIQFTINSDPKKSSAPLLPHPVPKVPDVYVPGEHPIRLHGHDFAVPDQCVPNGTTQCDASKANLTLHNSHTETWLSSLTKAISSSLPKPIALASGSCTATLHFTPLPG